MRRWVDASIALVMEMIRTLRYNVNRWLALENLLSAHNEARMKSCRVKFDRLTGTVELEAEEELKTGDYVVCDLEKGECLGVVATEPAETAREGLRKIAEEGLPRRGGRPARN